MQKLKYRGIGKERKVEYSIRGSEVIWLEELFEGIKVCNLIIELKAKSDTYIELVYGSDENREIHNLKSGDRGFLIIRNIETKMIVNGNCDCIIKWYEI